MKEPPGGGQRDAKALWWERAWPVHGSRGRERRRGRARSAGWVLAKCGRRGAQFTVALETDARKRLGGHRRMPFIQTCPWASFPPSPHLSAPTCSRRGHPGPGRSGLITPSLSRAGTHSQPLGEAKTSSARWGGVGPGHVYPLQPATPHLLGCLAASVFPDAPPRAMMSFPKAANF